MLTGCVERPEDDGAELRGWGQPTMQMQNFDSATKLSNDGWSYQVRPSGDREWHPQ